MIHLFRHSTGKNKGKFDIALVVRGKYILGSNQGYERKQGCYTAIRSLMKYFVFDSRLMAYSHFQFENIVYGIAESGKIVKTFRKPSKPYLPNTKKK